MAVGKRRLVSLPYLGVRVSDRKTFGGETRVEALIEVEKTGCYRMPLAWSSCSVLYSIHGSY